MLIFFLEQVIEQNITKAQGVTSLDPVFIRSILLDTARYAFTSWMSIAPPIRAMSYLHHPSPTKPHLLHRDLKPANILIKVRGLLVRSNELNGFRKQQADIVRL